MARVNDADQVTDYRLSATLVIALISEYNAIARTLTFVSLLSFRLSAVMAAIRVGNSRDIRPK